MCKSCFIVKSELNLVQKNCSADTTHEIEIPWVCCLCDRAFCENCVYHTTQQIRIGKVGNPIVVKHFCVICMHKFYLYAKSKL